MHITLVTHPKDSRANEARDFLRTIPGVELTVGTSAVGADAKINLPQILVGKQVFSGLTDIRSFAITEGGRIRQIRKQQEEKRIAEEKRRREEFLKR